MADKSFWSDKKDRKWLSNFWYYYRFSIFGIGFALILIIVTIVQCATSVTPDLSVSIASTYSFSKNITDNMEKAFSKYIDDIDGKDGVVTNVLSIDISSGEITSEYEIANAQKLFLEMTAGESYLYIMDIDIFEKNGNNEFFIDISDITGDKEPTYYVDVTNNKFLNNLGFKPKKNVYAGIHAIYGDRKNTDYEKEKQANATKALKAILKNQ